MCASQYQCVYRIFSDKIIHIIMYCQIHYFIFDDSLFDQRYKCGGCLIKDSELGIEVPYSLAISSAGRCYLGSYYTYIVLRRTYCGCLAGSRAYNSQYGYLGKTHSQVFKTGSTYGITCYNQHLYIL